MFNKIESNSCKLKNVFYGREINLIDVTLKSVFFFNN